MGHEYVKENETFNVNRNGTVPKPTQQDISDGKVLKADGTWGAGGGGASALSDLTDVNLSSLQDHQPLRYDATNQEWVNGADSYPPLIYSDEEREIGVWRDGKPLYEKTFTSTSSLRGVEWDISTLNIERVVSQKGSWCRKYNSNNKTYWYSVDFIASADASYRGATNVSLNDNVLSSTIDMPTGNAILYRAVTIQYTKTTDTAGSGTWTTQGGYAHHYSTSEKVIGTWIDGKPIYEKTIAKQNYRLESGSNQISLDVSNIDVLVDSNVQVTNSSHTNQRKLNVSEISGGSDDLYYIINYTTGVLWLYANATWGSPNIYITVQYTKSTV